MPEPQQTNHILPEQSITLLDQRLDRGGCMKNYEDRSRKELGCGNTYSHGMRRTAATMARGRPGEGKHDSPPDQDKEKG
jgi:hypothetical protein